MILLYCVAIGLADVMSQTTTMAPTRRPHVQPNLVTALGKIGGFGQILGILNSTGLTRTLLAEPEMTVFLPNNDALARLPPGALDALIADPQKLEDTLSYHVVRDTATKLRNDMELTSITGKPIRINTYGLNHKMSAEGVEITKTGIRVANGVVHVIGGIMTPPEGDIVDIILNRPDMTKLRQLLSDADLVTAIKNDHNMTLFAPNDAAFSQLDQKVLDYFGYNPETLKEVLLYHVISRQTLYSIGMRHTMTFATADGHHDNVMLIERGDEIFVNHARVMEKDISADNGVIHVVDQVLVPIRTILEIENQGLNANTAGR